MNATQNAIKARMDKDAAEALGGAEFLVLAQGSSDLYVPDNEPLPLTLPKGADALMVYVLAKRIGVVVTGADVDPRDVADIVMAVKHQRDQFPGVKAYHMGGDIDAVDTLSVFEYQLDGGQVPVAQVGTIDLSKTRSRRLILGEQGPYVSAFKVEEKRTPVRRLMQPSIQDGSMG